MKSLSKFCIAAALWASFVGWSASAQAGFIVDFETVPGGSPSEGLPINTQYAASTGMTFSLLGGGSPVLAETGAPLAAFQGVDALPDTMAPGQGAGSFFLTTAGVLTMSTPATLVVDLAVSRGRVSGYVLDLDGYEAWRVDAYDALHNLVESTSLTTSSPNAGNGLATRWSFLREENDISQIQIVYTGGLQWQVGFAFDNFSASHAPLPSSLALLLTGGASLLVPAWRRRRIAG